MKKEELEEIRPYYDEEINAALNRCTKNPIINYVLNFLFPAEKHAEIISVLNSCQSAYEFQSKFMYHAIRSITSKTSNGLTWSGIEDLSADVPYLFVANHRDIVLDSAILQTIMVDHEFPTTEITFGSNLMMLPFIVDVGKANRMFKVNRGGNPKEFLHNSQVLSEYIRYTITEKKASIWIAQRNGRTKDGNDKTEVALMKMLNMSGSGSIIENLFELNIVPFTISYEYEPCCLEKVNELYWTRQSKYEKKEGEDLASIIKGITQPKGRIHLTFDKPLNETLSSSMAELNKNEIFKMVTQAVDHRIYKNYRLWPTNYIAYDMLNGKNKYREQYTDEEKTLFLKHYNDTLSALKGDREELNSIFLHLYANPVINRESLNENS